MEGEYQVSVPGSLLGYVLFNVFLSDLKNMLNNEVNIPMKQIFSAMS